MEITIMTYATATVTPCQKSVTELRTVEISFYDHEIFVGQTLIASITYDHADLITQPWVVMVSNVEVHRANTWARCYRHICTHHKDGTLPVQEHQKTPAITGNEVMVEIAVECEKLGLELLDNGIYNNDQNLGQVGCTESKWWVKRASSVHRQKVLCDSVAEAVQLLSESLSGEDLLDKAFDQLTVDEWERLREYEPVSESGELVAA
jgi:hypothetical protein